MISLFTVPKAFKGHTAIIQRNAITSWTLLNPRPEILLFGDEPGIDEFANQLNLRHIPEVKRNEYGTPFINDVFEKARELASNKLLGYVNSDIIIFDGLMEAITRCIRWSQFLIVGRRLDADITQPVNFDENWKDHLAEVILEARLHNAEGIDYFIFPRDINLNMPAFVVGRPAWDNWLLFRVRSLGIPVIDATHAIKIIHQNHDYSHVPDREGLQWLGPEAYQNRKVAGGQQFVFTLDDATHILTKQVIKHALDYVHLRRRIESFAILNPSLTPLYSGEPRYSNFRTCLAAAQKTFVNSLNRRTRS